MRPFIGSFTCPQIFFCPYIITFDVLLRNYFEWVGQLQQVLRIWLAFCVYVLCVCVLCVCVCVCVCIFDTYGIIRTETCVSVLMTRP